MKSARGPIGSWESEIMALDDDWQRGFVGSSRLRSNFVSRKRERRKGTEKEETKGRSLRAQAFDLFRIRIIASEVSTVAVNRASGELVDPGLVHLVAMMPRQRSLMANNTTDRYRETGFERDGRRGKNKTRDSLFCWRRQSLVM